MIKVLIIDDEQHCVDTLTELIIPFYDKSIEIIGSAATIGEGIRSIANLKPDLVFLDVQIHDKTGFDLLETLPEINFAIIFTTAYEKFAIQAIRFSAIDYLLKPIDKNELNFALLKVISDSSNKLTAAKIDTLLENTEKNNAGLKKIIVPTNTGFELLEISEIVRCESEINYTTTFLKNKRKIVVAKTLKEFEEMLSGHFFYRIHNSHLINLAFIKSYNKGKGGSVTLSDGTQIEVSFRRKEGFLKKLSTL